MKILSAILLVLSLLNAPSPVSGQDSSLFMSHNNYLKIIGANVEFKIGNRIGCGWIEHKKNKMIIHDDARIDCMCRDTCYRFFPNDSKNEFVEYVIEVRDKKNDSLINNKEYLLFGVYGKDKHQTAWPDNSGDLTMRIPKNIKEINFCLSVSDYYPLRFVLSNGTSGKLILYLNKVAYDSYYYASSLKENKIKCKLRDNGILCVYKVSRNFLKYRRIKTFIEKVQ